MLHRFASQKERVLGRADKSKKGGVDLPVSALVDAINSSPAYFTTSSCSGRTVVFAGSHQQDASGRASDVVKKRGRWCYVTHDDASSDDLMSSLAPYLGNPDFYGTLKFEAMILHVQCKTIEDAQSMLSAALASGFRNSGLIIGRKRRVILAVRSTHGLEVPIVDTGKLLVSQEYIDYVVDRANNRMIENKRRIDRLHSNVCSMLDTAARKVDDPTPIRNTSHSSRDQRTVETRSTSAQAIKTTDEPTTMRVDSASGDTKDSSSDDDLVLPWEQT